MYVCLFCGELNLTCAEVCRFCSSEGLEWVQEEDWLENSLSGSFHIILTTEYYIE